jgi:hypothetical protein
MRRPAHLVDVAVICDSDDTHIAGITYFEYAGLNGQFSLSPISEPSRPMLFLSQGQTAARCSVPANCVA